MRTRYPLAACLSIAASFSAEAARAQSAELDVNRLKPAVTHGGFVTVEGSAIRPTSDRLEIGAMATYARNPLVLVDSGGSTTSRLVSGRLDMSLFASASLASWLAVGVDAPFFLLQTGDASPSFGGVGNLRIVPKIGIVRTKAVGFAMIPELRAPTHAGDFGGGARNVAFAPRFAADLRLGELRLGANLGALLREKTTYANVEAGSEVTYAGAASYRIGGADGSFALGAEVLGGVGFAAADVEEIPLEGLLFGRIFPGEDWTITAGPGIGLVPGYGIPTFRGFVAVTWSPTSARAPDQAFEPPPDSPTVDTDGDGIADAVDRCPTLAEDMDGDQDADGCPEEADRPDDDVDGITNAEDKCPSQKETINGFADDDGCPDEGPARVISSGGHIVILESVRFRNGSATIEQGSYPILNQVALFMKATPTIRKVRVEGHTDETGARDLNLRLSKARARAVSEYLVRRGVQPARLDAEGYGPDRPLVTGSDPRSRAKNRRVEFVLGP